MGPSGSGEGCIKLYKSQELRTLRSHVWLKTLLHTGNMEIPQNELKFCGIINLQDEE
jgi:hypothetical protein